MGIPVGSKNIPSAILVIAASVMSKGLKEITPRPSVLYYHCFLMMIKNVMCLKSRQTLDEPNRLLSRTNRRFEPSLWKVFVKNGGPVWSPVTFPGLRWARVASGALQTRQTSVIYRDRNISRQKIKRLVAFNYSGAAAS